MNNPGKRRFAILGLLATVLSFGSPALAGQPPQPNAEFERPGRSPLTRGKVMPIVGAQPTDQIIVKYAATSDGRARQPASAAQTAALEAAAGLQLTYFREMSGDATVFKLNAKLPEAEVRAATDRIMAQAAALGIEYAEPDSVMLPTAMLFGPDEPMLTPNDTRYGEMWHLKAVGAYNYGANLPGAWDITTGSSGVRVAVIDTGTRFEHPDLAGRFNPGYDFISNAAIANDGDGRDGDPTDPGDYVAANECFPGSSPHTSSWHGTHVAGTIGAIGNNASGIAGINWVSKMVTARVLGKCGGLTSDTADAMRWSAGLAVAGVPANANPARVLNMSLGGVGACNATYQNAVNDVNGANAILVIAAGNSRDEVAGYQPASCNGVLTVGATNRIGDLAMYSNRGSRVVVSAPGGDTYYGNSEGVLSTINLGATTPGASGYTFYQGTSMAAPHVAGIVSLMLSVNNGLNRDQVFNIVRRTATPFPANSSCTTSQCGAGIINAAFAVSAARPGQFRQLFIPIAARPGPAAASKGIYGVVTFNGAPLNGATVRLWRVNWNSGTSTNVATTTTNGAGEYKFTSATTLGTAQSYLVVYTQDTDETKLFSWDTRHLPIYSAGREINIGSFDVADLALNSPDPGAIVSLPRNFSWTMRSASPSDSYGLRVFDPNDGNPFYASDPSLGHVSNTTLATGVLGMYGFTTGVVYGWDATVSSPDHGIGFSYYYNEVTFSSLVSVP